MTIDAVLWRASLLALAGAAVSMALGGIVNYMMAPGLAQLAISTLVTAMGLVITGLVVWTGTRDCAGDVRRPGLVSVLAFLAVHERAWLDFLQLEGSHQVISAQFVLTCVAFGLAMLVFKSLAPIDAREARANTAHELPPKGAPLP